MPYKLSPSSLSLLKDCPRCFWLHFNEKLMRPQSIFPSLPGGMDRILKAHFDVFRDRGALPPELSSLGDDVKLFGKTELLEEWRNNFKGIKWADESGNLLRGAIDNLLQKGNKLIVLDFKTRGYPLKDNTADYYQDQLDIYNFLFRKNGYETEDYAYLLFYHPDKVNEDGTMLFNSDLVRMPISVQNAENIFKRAIATLNGTLPEASRECGFCGWGGEMQNLTKNG